MPELFEILTKEEIAPKIYRMDIYAPAIAQKRKAGQFVILRVYERGERIPLTIVDSDPEQGSVLLVFQVMGKTTAMLSDMEVGERLADFVGPLGSPTHIENYGTAVCVAGGVGTAAAYPIAKALKEAGNHLISIVGARTKDLLIMTKEMEAISDRLELTTDDGSYGFHGFVTDRLKKMIDEEKVHVDMVLAVGPAIMMKAVSDLTRPYGIKTIVSLNPIMVDGTGMCGMCRVRVGDEIKFACVDGPEFDGHLVDFDELMKRQRMFVEQERRAYEEYLKSKQSRYEEGVR